MQLGTDSVTSTGATVGVSRRTAQSGTFFGEDGLTWRDALDAINPLEHIPILSDLFDSATGHKPSAAAKLAGGALLGGPIGFVVSLANVIFESQTGKGVGGAVLAALTGDETPNATQYAENDAATEVAANAAPVDDVAVADQQAPASSATAQQFASAAPVSATPLPANQTVLDLYGGSAASAHQSYKKAQMLPYLRDVNTSQVL